MQEATAIATFVAKFEKTWNVKPEIAIKKSLLAKPKGICMFFVFVLETVVYT
jgi:hypothetical protein